MREVPSAPGSCQFACLAHQVFGTSSRSAEVRNAVVSYIRTHLERYDGLLLPTPSEYLAKMSAETTWGDHVTLDAAANVYSLKIELAADFDIPTVIIVEPAPSDTGSCLTPIYLAIYPENHYLSLDLIGETLF